MKIKVLFFLIFTTVFNLNAQERYTKQIDSLQTLISNVYNDTLRVNLYGELSSTYMKLRQNDAMLATSEEGLSLAKKLNYKKGIALLTLRKAIALDLKSEFQKAIGLYDKGLQITKRNGFKNLEAKYYLNIGACYYFSGNINLALKNYLETYNLWDYISDKERSMVLNNIGVIYRSQNEYQRAEEIYLQSYELKKTIKDSVGMAASLMNLGLVYRTMENRTNDAISSLKQSLTLYKSLELLFDEATCNLALATIYHKENNYKLTKSYVDKAWEYFRDQNHIKNKIEVLMILGDVALVYDKDYKLAENYLEEALNLIDKHNQKLDYLEVLSTLGEVKKGLNKNDEAYNLLKEAYQVKDTLNQEAKIASMQEMQTKFDVKQKEADLEISQLTLKRRTEQRNLILIGVACLFVLAITVYFFMRHRVIANKKIAEQADALRKTEIEQLQQKHKLLALNSVVEGQESERMRIAKDLHDSLGGLLSSIKAHFTTIQNEVSELKDIDLANRTNDLIDEACVEVRRISHNMIPQTLSLSGLPNALEDLSEDLETQGYNVDLSITNFPKNIDKTKQAMLFRAMQEAINNIKKHANAKNILIQVFGTKGSLGIIIEDDGKGFNYQEAINSSGVGLKSIASRIDVLNGTIDWDSTLGVGTTLTINIPKI